MRTVGLGGVARHGCVALSDRGRIVGVCEQERITRMRNAGFNTSGLPDEALDAPAALQRRIGDLAVALVTAVRRQTGGNCLCILANPFAPYALENLNQFLKHREPWRGYGLSGLEHAVGAHFDGPGRSNFMEYDYRPLEPGRFAHVLPSSAAVVRLQTVGADAPPRFTRLLEAFGAATGLPFLVNTSFNGFREPIVCNPRDAVRVFHGTGIDVLVADQFVLKK